MRFRTLLLAFLLATPALGQTPDTLFDAAYNGTSRFHVNVNGGLTAGGNYTGTTGSIPAEGPGTRMMWYPEKAAFRAGNVQGGLIYTDLNHTTTGTEWDDINVGTFSTAFGQTSWASGNFAFAAGNLAAATGTSSVALGENTTASGHSSVALGYHAHTNARQGSFVFADRSTVDYLRAGVNHSANWRVSGGFRIFTSSNLSTGVTIQSGASVSNWGQSNAVISTSTGALLTTGGMWQNASDSTRKHLFEPVSGEDVLERLSTLPIRRWSYRSEPDSIRHMGPTSQDFRAAFGLGGDDKSIGTVDADGVALVAAQALELRTRKLAAQIESLQAENAELRARLDALEETRGVFTAGTPVLAMLVLGVGGAAGLFARRRQRVA